MNETPDMQPPTTNYPQQPKVADMQRKTSKLPWIVLSVVVVLSAGVITWLLMQNQATQSSLTSKEQQLKTAQSSLATKNQQVDITQDDKTSTDTTSTDDEMIVKTTLAWAQAYKGSEDAKLTVAVAKKDLPFARATVNTEESGYACVLKKSNDIWLVLFCGQDSPTQDVLDKWGVPASVLTSQ